jgi:hypothetical protein
VQNHVFGDRHAVKRPEDTANSKLQWKTRVGKSHTFTLNWFDIF